MLPREANSVFVRIPDPVIHAFHQEGPHFHTFIGLGGARLMCSWGTTEKAITAFVDDLKASIAETS